MMTHHPFFLHGKRHQVNWTGPGYYMAVDNGASVAIWPVNWRYVTRSTPSGRELPHVFYLGQAAWAKAAIWLGLTFRQSLAIWNVRMPLLFESRLALPAPQTVPAPAIPVAAAPVCAVAAR